MEILHQRCAGLDVSKNDVKVTIRTQRSDGHARYETTTWGATTSDILALRDFLVDQQVTAVIMESTSDYWKPFYYLLEDQLHVELVNARQTKHVPGRKSDVTDSGWLSDLGAHGLVKASFVPGPQIRQLRDLTRARTQIKREQNRDLQRIDAVLQDAGIKLSSVASKLTTKSAQNIIAALAAGTTDPQTLADLALGKFRDKITELAQAMQAGRFTRHHQFMLGLHQEQYQMHQTQIDRLEARIDELMAPFQARIDQLTSIPGIADTVAHVIIAETGGDLSVFPTADHLASWAGVAPGINQSANRNKNATTPPGNQHLQAALGIAALGIIRGKDTFLKSRYRRIAARRGNSRAIVALQHTILIAIWHMFRDGTYYNDPGADYYTRRRPAQAARRALDTLRTLGYTVTLRNPSTAVVQT